MLAIVIIGMMKNLQLKLMIWKIRGNFKSTLSEENLNLQEHLESSVLFLLSQLIWG